jgi:hypothetical protein
MDRLVSQQSWATSSVTYTLRHNVGTDSDFSNNTRPPIKSKSGGYRIDVSVVDGRAHLLAQTTQWICEVIDVTTPEEVKTVQQGGVVNSAPSSDQPHHDPSESPNAVLTFLDAIGRNIRLVVEFTQSSVSQTIDAVNGALAALTAPSVQNETLLPVVYVDGCVSGSGVHHSVTRQLQSLGFTVKIVESPSHLQTLLGQLPVSPQTYPPHTIQSLAKLGDSKAPPPPPVIVLLLPASLCDAQNSSTGDTERRFKARAYADSDASVFCCCVVHSSNSSTNSVGSATSETDSIITDRVRSISIQSVTEDCWKVAAIMLE